MNVSVIQSQVAVDLPNFPAEIIEEWIGHYAESEGWPPPTPLVGRWRNLLAGHPFAYWKGLIWSKEDLSPLRMTLTDDCADLIGQIIEAHINGQKNNYSHFMGVEGREQFYHILRFLVSHGTFPKAPVVLHHANDYEIMDGNHRFAAYIAWSQLRQAPQALEILHEAPVPLRERVSFWVGRSVNNGSRGASVPTGRRL